MPYRSETSVTRDLIVEKWIFPERENGLDLGFGGDPISVNAIAMDLPLPYAQTEDENGQSYHQHLRGDARYLHWFRDGVLDYVYSSHLLEDFPNTAEILTEWFRVLKSGGRLVLLLPDEQLYRLHCAATGQPYNSAHQQPKMSKEFIADIVTKLGHRVLHAASIPPYSFIVVAERV